MSASDFESRVAARAEQLVDERMDIPARVAAELDEIIGTSDVDGDGNTHFSADLALVLDSSDVAFEAHAIAFFVKLRERVKTSLHRDAETDAAAEIARHDDDAAEARDMARSRWAA